MGLPQPLWSSVLLIYHLSSPPKLITHPQSFYKSWNQRNNLKFWTNYPKYNKISTKKKIHSRLSSIHFSKTVQESYQ